MSATGTVFAAEVHGKWKMYVTDELQDKAPVGFCALPECEGHDTSDEAKIHFTEWMADCASFDGPLDKNHECMVCNQSTKKAAFGPFDMKIPLCRKHNNTGGVVKVVLQIIRGER